METLQTGLMVFFVLFALGYFIIEMYKKLDQNSNEGKIWHREYKKK